MNFLDEPSDLLGHLAGLVSIADRFKSEIGFWPRNGLAEAIKRGRLCAVTESVNGDDRPVGFIVFGGVFPNGRIQAVAVDPEFQREGVAQFLLDSVVSKMEAEGYLAISAKPAEDLATAQAFYQKNQFLVVRTQPGGTSRNRKIVVRERTLRSPSLFSLLEADNPKAPQPKNGLRSDLWVVDINVLFDLLKARRARRDMAMAAFSAAFDGRVKLAVTTEFSSELARSPQGQDDDPLLTLANALPRLRVQDKQEVDRVAGEIHQLVFERQKPSQAGTVQAISDCTHLAECVACNASAFITSDGVLLRNGRTIRETWGLEVVSLEDFHDALSSTVLAEGLQSGVGLGFRLRSAELNAAKCVADRLANCEAQGAFFEEAPNRATGQFMLAEDENGCAVGVLAFAFPTKLGEPHNLLLLADRESTSADLVADALLRKAIDAIGGAGVNIMGLVDVPGQLSVRKAALRAGFASACVGSDLTKPAIGTPVTPASFAALGDRARVFFGAAASELFPRRFDDFDILFANDPKEFSRIERLFAPALIVPSNRRVCIQPIQRAYADELLGTTNQTSFLSQFEGAFRSQKIYVSGGRTKNFFKNNQIILFYESSRGGGRSAVVAAARVDDVVCLPKGEVGRSHMKGTVLNSVDRFSASEEVTLTSFSSLLRFPRPVSLSELHVLNAAGTQNLRSATPIATAAAQQIFDRGWDIGN